MYEGDELCALRKKKQFLYKLAMLKTIIVKQNFKNYWRAIINDHDLFKKDIM